MADDAARFDLLDAARLMQELALAYGDNHDEAPAALIRQFEAAAAGLAEEIGEVEITNEDDEELVLTAGGHFTGRVLVDDPSPQWKTIDSPADVAEHYDPADLFADLADAVADAFPEIDPAASAGEAADPEPEPRDQPAAIAPADDPLAEESATLQSLRTLHAAGVLTDEEFEAKRAELRQ